jgi:hypothetical protein
MLLAESRLAFEAVGYINPTGSRSPSVR